MFLKELFHDTIKLGKKRLNGYYLLILTFGVGVGNFFLWGLLLLLRPFLGATFSSSESESVASSHVPFLRSCFFFLAPPLAMKHMGRGGSELSNLMAIPVTSSSSEESSSSSSCSS